MPIETPSPSEAPTSEQRGEKRKIHHAISELERLNYEIGYLDALHTPDDCLIDARDKTKALLDEMLIAPPPPTPKQGDVPKEVIEAVAEPLKPFLYDLNGTDLHIKAARAAIASYRLLEAYSLGTGEEIISHFLMLWHEYAVAPDDILTEKAQQLKRKLLDIGEQMGVAYRAAEVKGLLLALEWLVGLKDNHPADYQEQKPLAWAAARAALSAWNLKHKS